MPRPPHENHSPGQTQITCCPGARAAEQEPPPHEHSPARALTTADMAKLLNRKPLRLYRFPSKMRKSPSEATSPPRDLVFCWGEDSKRGHEEDLIGPQSPQLAKGEDNRKASPASSTHPLGRTSLDPKAALVEGDSPMPCAPSPSYFLPAYTSPLEELLFALIPNWHIDSFFTDLP